MYFADHVWCHCPWAGNMDRGINSCCGFDLQGSFSDAETWAGARQRGMRNRPGYRTVGYLHSLPLPCCNCSLWETKPQITTIFIFSFPSCAAHRCSFMYPALREFYQSLTGTQPWKETELKFINWEITNQNETNSETQQVKEISELEGTIFVNTECLTCGRSWDVS